MNDAIAVQRSRGTGQSDRDVTAFLQPERRGAGDSRFQKLALIKRHDRIKTGLPSLWQFDDATQPRTADPRANPCFAQERLVVGSHLGNSGLGELEYHVTPLDLIEGREQTRISAFRYQRFEHKTIDGLATLRHGDDRQL